MMRGVTRDGASSAVSTDEMIATCLELMEKIGPPPKPDFNCVKIPKDQVPDVIKVKSTRLSCPPPGGLPCIDVAGDLYVMSPDFLSSIRHFQVGSSDMNVIQFEQSDKLGRGLY